VRTSIRDTLQQLGFEQRLGPEHFHLHIRDAVADFVRRTRAQEAAATTDGTAPIAGVTTEQPRRNPPTNDPPEVGGRPADAPEDPVPGGGAIPTE
jgi:hypothetical protein